MTKFGFFAVVLLLAAPAIAQEQPRMASGLPEESVTSTALREQQMRAFIQSRAAPSFRIGKLQRWERPLCPAAAGLKPALLQFIVQRVKETAAKVGAPVNRSSTCRYNVQIVFSSVPQRVVNFLRQQHEDLLGAHDTSVQADALARFDHPMQSWYATATIDARGSVHGDGKRRGPLQCLDLPECKFMLDADSFASTGTRLGDGLRTGLMNVVVVADRDRLVDHEIGALADYIAFLVLAQPSTLDDCQALPSILNMLARDCPAGPQELSAVDIAYLKGLYHMQADMMLTGQKNEILYRMKQALAEMPDN